MRLARRPQHIQGVIARKSSPTDQRMHPIAPEHARTATPRGRATPRCHGPPRSLLGGKDDRCLPRRTKRHAEVSGRHGSGVELHHPTRCRKNETLRGKADRVHLAALTRFRSASWYQRAQSNDSPRCAPENGLLRASAAAHSRRSGGSTRPVLERSWLKVCRGRTQVAAVENVGLDVRPQLVEAVFTEVLDPDGAGWFLLPSAPALLRRAQRRGEGLVVAGDNKKSFCGAEARKPDSTAGGGAEESAVEADRQRALSALADEWALRELNFVARERRARASLSPEEQQAVRPALDRHTARAQQ
jgi:hypothetical protein